MKAVVYYAPGDIRVENRPMPVEKEDNIIVEVKCCSICGTDLKIATVGNPRCHPPRIIGHEMVGHIIFVGSEVKGYSIGERITLATTISCGECNYCKMGLGNLCPNAKPISYDYDGAFAEYIELPYSAIKGGNIIKVPDNVSDEAALCEPISCAINSHEIVGLRKDDYVVIIGGGPLGAIHAELAKAQGAKEVIIVEIDEARLKLLQRLKGVILIDSSNKDVLSIIRSRTNDMGADIIIVCAPSKSAMEQSITLVRKGGGICFFASLAKEKSEIQLDSRIIHYGELRISGASDSRPEHVRKAVRMLSDGDIDYDAIITHRISLDRIHEGFELMKNRNSLKVLVYPKGF